MPYTAHHLYDCQDHLAVQNAAASRRLWAESDADAVRQADVWLRSSRVVAGVTGDERPMTGGMKDGQQIACVTLENAA